jgi:nitrite reductase/ring-hydroxylating ferredoxin subunit
MISFQKKITWHKILDAAEELAEARPAAFVVEDKTICIVKKKDKVFAVDDRCPHQGASLSAGYCEKGFIVCPWHHYAFDLKTGRQDEEAGDYVETYPVEIREDGVYVGVEKMVFSLFS